MIDGRNFDKLVFRHNRVRSHGLGLISRQIFLIRAALLLMAVTDHEFAATKRSVPNAHWLHEKMILRIVCWDRSGGFGGIS